MASFPGPHVFGIAAKALEGWPGGIFLACAKTRRGGSWEAGFCVVVIFFLVGFHAIFVKTDDLCCCFFLSIFGV